MKKHVSVFLVFCLILTNFSGVLADTTIHSPETKQTIEKTAIKPLDFLNLNDDDEIRVIIELEDDAVIDTAIANGKRVSDMSKADVKREQANLILEQAIIKEQINTLVKDGVEYHDAYTTIMNGFSATMTVAEANQIANLSGVSAVHPSTVYQRPEPAMKSSGEITHHTEAWDYGYTGEGMVVAIIDTGLDPYHKDFNLSNPQNAKIKTLDGLDVPGTYVNPKVPYAYNYIDQNDQVLDIQPDASEHGMHVAGTVSANGEIKGVAPEAQLLAMKVFSNDPSISTTYGDVYIKAIDDAVLLGADAINMSLGSGASFVVSETEDPTRTAINKAVKSGVVVAIAAGNDGRYGRGTHNDWTKTTNPDDSTVGSPSVFPSALSVASIENTQLPLSALTFTTTNGAVNIAYQSSSNVAPVNAYDEPKPYVYCNLGGDPSDFPADVNGKIALIQRGKHPFSLKTKNAINSGAIGVIIFNHEDGGNEVMGMNLGDVVPKIPVIFIGHDDGQLLLNSYTTSPAAVSVEFTDKEIIKQNPNAGKMSSFSSWGPTPNLDFKPEITAPGGQIYSTLQKNHYGMMSGTSMATPHVAGASALILNRIDKDFNLPRSERAVFAKNLMMSTATPHMSLAHPKLSHVDYTSPRQQGAGVMNVFAALTADTIVVDPRTDISKIALKEIGDETTFSVKIDNTHGGQKTYAIDVPVLAPLSSTGYNWVSTQQVIDAVKDVKVNGQSVDTITVTTGASITLDITLNLTNAKDWKNTAPLKSVFPNGTFIDGFVILTDVNDASPQLSIPYMGFYGKWDKAPIFDVDIYSIDEDKGIESFYEETAIVYPNGEKLVKLGETSDGYKSEAIAFSPNGDNINDIVAPQLTLLRNAAELELNILDANKHIIRHLSSDKDIVKNFYNNGHGEKFVITDDWIWDGKINNKQMTSGQYYFQAKAKIDYPDAQWQTIEIPISIDNVAPMIKTFTYDASSNTITATATDNAADELYYTLMLDGKIVASNWTGVFKDLIQDKNVHKAQVIVSDYAENNAISDTIFINQDEDTTEPFVILDTPKPFAVLNHNDVVFKGHVEESTALKSLTIDGQPIDTTFDETTNTYAFEFTQTIEDGVKEIRISATDINNHQLDYLRTIYVDSTAPKINVKNISDNQSIYVDHNATSYDLEATITDNFPSLTVRVDGNEVYKTKTDPKVGETGEGTLTYNLKREIKLKQDITRVTISFVDYGGNNIDYKLAIIKKDPPEKKSKHNSAGGSSSKQSDDSSAPKTKNNKDTVKQNTSEIKFVDIGNEVAWAEKAINTLIEKSIINGVDDTHFEPNRDITRAEFATLLYRAFDFKKSNSVTFDDINGWYKEAIESLASEGIIKGYENNKFMPSKTITRQEMAVMIMRILHAKHANLTSDAKSIEFADAINIADWAKADVAEASRLGIIKGYGNNFGPKDNATRAQSATMLYRLIELLEKK